MTEKTKFLLSMLIFVAVLLIVVFGALAAEAHKWKSRMEYAKTLEFIQVDESFALYDPASGRFIAASEGGEE